MKQASATIRLNKLLANLGFSARRKIEQFLEENNLEVNGKRIKEPGFRINPKKDKILLNNQPLSISTNLVYFILNKPKGVISTTSDEHARKSVVSLIPTKERIYPVGRLDQTTTGLIILTNDGELANKLTHPRYQVPKTYQALISRVPTKDQLNELRSGVYLKEGKTAPAQIEILKQYGNRTLLELTLYEGKNHEVKRMCSKVGLEIIDLKRVSIGPLKLGNLPLGSFRKLTPSEIEKLNSLKGVALPQK